MLQVALALAMVQQHSGAFAAAASASENNDSDSDLIQTQHRAMSPRMVSSHSTSASNIEEEAVPPSDPLAEFVECASLAVANDSTIPAHRWYDRATRTFVPTRIPQLYCVGEHCDPERRPDSVYCNVVQRRLNGRTAPVPIIELRWQCEVARPAWLSDVVQFHGFDVECASTVDGTKLKLPSVGSVLDGHNRLTGRNTRIRRDDFVAGHEASDKAYIHDPMPNLLLVAREAKEWNPNCAYRAALRKVSLHDLVVLRASLAANDPEHSATQALALGQQEDTRATTETAPVTVDSYLHDAVVAAEVCRVKFSVRLIYKQSAVISILCLSVSVVAIFASLACGMISRKNRTEVQRAQAIRALKQYEDDVGRRMEIDGGGSKAALKPPAATRQPSPSTAALAAAGEYFGSGVDGLTPDEMMMRADLLQRSAALEVPRNVSASQFVRQRGSGGLRSSAARRVSSSASGATHVTLDQRIMQAMEGGAGATAVTLNTFQIDEIVGE